MQFKVKSKRSIDEQTFLRMCNDIEKAIGNCVVTPLDRVEGGFEVHFNDSKKDNATIRFHMYSMEPHTRFPRWRQFDEYKNIPWTMFWENGRVDTTVGIRKPEEWENSTKVVFPTDCIIVVKMADYKWKVQQRKDIKSVFLKYDFDMKRM